MSHESKLSTRKLRVVTRKVIKNATRKSVLVALYHLFQLITALCTCQQKLDTGNHKTTWQLIKLYTTKILAILLGGKVIEGIGRALLVEEDHIIIDFLSDRLITGHV